MPNNDTIENEYKELQKNLYKILSQERNKQFKDPELIKVYGVILDQVDDIRRLYCMRSKSPNNKVNQLIKQQLETNVSSLTIDSAWALADTLKRSKLLIGDQEYINNLMYQEHQREEEGKKDNRPGPYLSEFYPYSGEQINDKQRRNEGQSSDNLTNSQKDDKPSGESVPTNGDIKSTSEDEKTLAEDDSLDQSMLNQEDEETLINKEKIHGLTALYLARSNEGRHIRARARIKKQYLDIVSIIMAILLVGIFVVMSIILGGANWKIELVPSFAGALMACIGGALGSTISSTLKLRDQIGRIDDLREFSPLIVVQLVVGAISGLIIYSVFESGVIVIGNPESNEWAYYTILGFIAGFSEPFFLGTIKRIQSLSGDISKKT